MESGIKLCDLFQTPRQHSSLALPIRNKGLPQWLVKNLPAMQEPQETKVQSLGREDPLEEKMATHSSILAWRFPWTMEPGGQQSMGHRVRHD